MSYASLAGLPDTACSGLHGGADPVDLWYSMRAEADMDVEPDSRMGDHLWLLGDAPTRDDLLSDDTTFVREFYHGAWVEITHVEAQPFPCGPECAT